jgi:hypothetical protein
VSSALLATRVRGRGPDTGGVLVPPEACSRGGGTCLIPAEWAGCLAVEERYRTTPCCRRRAGGQGHFLRFGSAAAADGESFCVRHWDRELEPVRFEARRLCEGAPILRGRSLR